MAKRRTSRKARIDFAFFVVLRQFYEENRGRIRTYYRDLTKRFLDYNEGGYLRRPQFEALEMYVFLKEFLDNAPVHAIFRDWADRQGRFEGRSAADRAGQRALFDMPTRDQYDNLYEQMQFGDRAYANYIFALTMGTGKTILMATCIFYEFILANKFPKDPKYCHNALVFAPDTTVLEALREMQTFELSKVVPPEYANWLTTNIKFHFLDKAGMTLDTLDRSMFNLIISNTQKVILKRQHKELSPFEQIFQRGHVDYEEGSVFDEFSDLFQLDDETELATNQRFQKLQRLSQMGIYIDEAHHAFGRDLARDVGAQTDTRKTSLRLTVDRLAESLERTGTHVVACYNYTGTPYADNQILPEVVYAYGLQTAIDEGNLKQVRINGYTNPRTAEFVDLAIDDFLDRVANHRPEGMLPKMAFFAATIDELQDELRPAVERTLAARGIPVDRILVNVGDEKLTSNDDIREFNRLDTPDSNKQFILLVNKGREGWNCRSLFAVSLFRKPKSKIFVLQATMRCLRAVGQGQQTGHVYLSDENLEILHNELAQNFRISVDELTSAGADKQPYQIRVKMPPVAVEIKRVRHMYEISEKSLAPGTSLELDKAREQAYRYRLLHQTIKGLPASSRAPFHTEDISHIRDQRRYSRLILVAEIARYLNKPCLEIEDMLHNTAEGVDAIIELVNEFNEHLYDWIIPRLFSEIVDLEQSPYEDKDTVVLAQIPPEGFYQMRAEPDKVITDDDVDPAQAAKSFHLDTYCFDSNPERQLFHYLLSDDRVRALYFTGMLTHGQSEFYVQYIDPETHALRSYYPDFLIQLEDGSYLVLEVKGDHQIEDPIVLAKQDFAQQMAVANGMTYRILKSTDAQAGNYAFIFSGDAPSTTVPLI